MKYFKLVVIIFTFLLFFGAKNSYASDGEFNLRSTTQYDYRCLVYSLDVQKHYRVIVKCKNIIYPVDGTIYSYVLWANPKNGGDPVKLGQIGLGKGEYTTKSAFASIFVTTEKNAKVKAPSGEVVMRGSVKPSTFLEETVEPTTGSTDDDSEQAAISPTPEPTKASTRDRLITGLKRAGLASGLALIAILGLVFVLTRPK